MLKLFVDKIDPIRFDENDPPSGMWYARAHIGVATVPSQRYRYLSAECAGPSEIEYWANELIRELEEIKRKAAQMAWRSTAAE